MWNKQQKKDYKVKFTKARFYKTAIHDVKIAHNLLQKPNLVTCLHIFKSKTTLRQSTFGLGFLFLCEDNRLHQI